MSSGEAAFRAERGRAISRREFALFQRLILQETGIYLSDANGKLLNVNPALVKTLGYDSPAELLAIAWSSRWTRLCAPADQLRILDAWLSELPASTST